MIDSIGNKIVKRINSKHNNVLACLAFDVHYGDCVSNSHSAPVGKKQNWGGREEGVPRGYPGWSGRLWIVLNHEPRRFGSDILHSSGIYSGTGGGGNYGNPYTKSLKELPKKFQHYGWDTIIWCDDFPEESKEILEFHRVSEAVAKISGERYSTPTERYVWMSKELQRVLDDEKSQSITA